MNRIISSPVLVMDALGLSAEMKRADTASLQQIASRLDRQYLRFRRTVPHRLILILGNWVWGTKEFITMRLGDMFVLYAGREEEDIAFKYLIAASLLYHAMLIEGFIPRGGLGFGIVMAGEGALLGKGFIDAYEASEKREFWTRDICAIRVSDDFLRTIKPSSKAHKMLCFYRDQFFVNPIWLSDSSYGKFDRDRIKSCLKQAGVNQEKYDATAGFLDGFEDYYAAMMPGSQSSDFISRTVQRRGLPGPLS